ncbi:helix-turn-helix transcriptional regulator [Devosia sp.]|uniref:helix-turn-helix transcriptional regulator n=1 Tax=Devosia sp. TaxID=1871048 RepID=UPI002F1A6AB5
MINEDIVSEIYESAAFPPLWSSVLQRLMRLCDADAGVLHTVNDAGIAHHATAGPVAELYASASARELIRRSVRVGRALTQSPAGFASDRDLATESELREDELYSRHLRPLGFHFAVGTVIAVPTGDLLVMGFLRGEDGPFDRHAVHRLNTYRRHIARAALVAHRLGLRAARTQAEALATIGIPGAVIDGAGRVLAANHEFEQLAPRVRFDAAGRLSLATKEADQLLHAALTAAAAGAAEEVNSIPLAGLEAAPPLVLHVVPVRGVANDIFRRAAALVVVTAVAMPKAPLREVLYGLFDLTPAEARVAAALVRGGSVESVAAATGVSTETVRTQLKSVMAKTGTNRQTELVLLLSGAQLPERSG